MVYSVLVDVFIPLLQFNVFTGALGVGTPNVSAGQPARSLDVEMYYKIHRTKI